MAESSDDFIPCMLIPVGPGYLLLPNSTIAEVIPMPRYQTIPSASNIILGQSNWHDNPLYLIDLKALFDEMADFELSKLCIVYSAGKIAGIETFGLPCSGIPQLINLNQNALKLVQQDKTLSSFIHCQTHIGNKVASIPNLDAIELQLKTLNVSD